MTLTAVAALVLPASASANILVTVSGGELIVGDDSDASIIAVNHLDPSPQPGYEFHVTSVSGAGTNDSECVEAGNFAVFCDDTNVSTIVVNGGGGNDTIEVENSGDPAVPSSYETLLDGSLGLDSVTGGDGDDELRGGNDTLGDTLQGRSGADTLYSGDDGPDTLSGGLNGTFGDALSYLGEPASVRVDLDGDNDDGVDCPGPSCENDDPSTIENVIGGGGKDTLIGDELNNVISGGSGDDLLAGGGGTGPDGDDTFNGGAHAGLGDTVSYQDRDDAILVNLSLSSNNGQPVAGTPDLDDIGSSVENATGGDGADELLGDENPNRLSGGEGNDELSGGTGTGPDGADVFTGGGSTFGSAGDLVSYETRSDAVTADLGSGADEDGDQIGADLESLTGGSGPDTLTGDAGGNVLTGLDGNDSITGLGGGDRFHGNDDDDTLFTADEESDPTIDCGADVTDDTAFFDSGIETPNANCEIQTPAEPPSADLSLTMTVGNPSPGVGSTTTFTLRVANAGPEDTSGVLVLDTLPVGLDHVSNTPAAGTTYTPNPGLWNVGPLASGASKTLGITVRVTRAGQITNVAEVQGSALPDPDSAPHNGAPGEDDRATATLFGPSCAGKPATIVGTGGANTLRGTPAADVIAGLNGNDKALGLGGNDVVCAGGGNDTGVGGAGKDLLRGQAGKDRLRGGGGRDRLIGGAGRDRLLGGAGRDILRGGPGRDRQRQ